MRLQLRSLCNTHFSGGFIIWLGGHSRRIEVREAADNKTLKTQPCRENTHTRGTNGATSLQILDTFCLLPFSTLNTHAYRSCGGVNANQHACLAEDKVTIQSFRSDGISTPFLQMQIQPSMNYHVLMQLVASYSHTLFEICVNISSDVRLLAPHFRGRCSSFFARRSQRSRWAEFHPRPDERQHGSGRMLLARSHFCFISYFSVCCCVSLPLYLSERCSAGE